MPDDEVLMVMTHLPDRDSAQRLARAVVEARVAACANVLGGCRSVYRWNGAIETADETPVLIKTTRARYRALEETVRAHHPYEVPEILAFPAADGLDVYLEWVRAETRPV